jgi:hypothetical protein
MHSPIPSDRRTYLGGEAKRCVVSTTLQLTLVCSPELRVNRSQPTLTRAAFQLARQGTARKKSATLWIPHVRRRFVG